MSGPGRPAALPPHGWKPPPQREGLRVKFVSEDGQQQRLYDFATLDGHEELVAELAVAFAAATGPLGTYKRLTSAKHVWNTASTMADWLREHRPALTSLSQLGPADVRELARSMATPSGNLRANYMRGLLAHLPVVPQNAIDELTRLRFPKQVSARQPYTAAEAERIAVVARALVRQARSRLEVGWETVAACRRGEFDTLDRQDPRRCLAEVLDHCAREGDFPRATNGRPTSITKIATGMVGRYGVQPMLHLTHRDVWAFSVLLAGLTGYNACMLADLPAPSFKATAPTEPGIKLLRLSKPRRGKRSEMTLPIDAVPHEFRPDPDDPRPEPVLRTSLTSALGAYTLLIDLTTPAREFLDTDRAFVFYNGQANKTGGWLHTGLNQVLPPMRARWVSPWLTKDADRDEVLLGISLDRLRKTYLERTRRPVAHTTHTFAGYLRRMNTATVDSFQIVREALEDEVDKALQRRKMTVTTDTAQAEIAAATTDDTVLGACTDFDHPPDGEDGMPCRHSFLHCLDCSNARAFPHHLPMQLLILDELLHLQSVSPVPQRVTRFAGAIAQLTDIIEEYEPAQRDHARAQITDHHRHLAHRLLAGELEAS